MRAFCIRNIVVVTLHELRSLMVNPSMLATLFMLLAFGGLFSFLGFFRWFATPFLCQLAICSVGFIGTICTAAEEREQGVFITLSYAGLSPLQLAIGKTVACIVLAEAVSFICAYLIEVNVLAAAMVAACMATNTVPVALFSVAVGLHLNDQQRASSWGAVPLILGILAPAGKMLWGISFWFLPLGAASELVDVFQHNGTAAIDPAITVLVALLYATICGIGLCLSIKRFERTDPARLH